MNNNPNNRRQVQNRQPQRPPQNRVPQQRTQNQMPKGSYTSNFTIVCVIVIALLFAGVIKVFSGIITGNPDKVIRPKAYVIEEQKKADAEAARKKEIEDNFVKLPVNEDDTKTGNLVLVNNDYSYSFDTSPKAVKKNELVSIGKPENRDYVVSYFTETMTRDAIFSFSDLATDFMNATGHKDLIIVDSIRSIEDQERLYAEKGPEIATKPGYSEHHTGLALDVSIYQKGNFDGTGDYAYVAENCHKYGYILRYPENKTDLTGISYEPWHFRYVGKEHAAYMKQNDLCLEEYILNILPNYPIDSARLHVTTDDGAQYEIYSVPVSGEAEIYVPKEGEYSLSGDNNGHIIVSKKLGSGETVEVEIQVENEDLTE